jgi:hypothetical protein
MTRPFSIPRPPRRKQVGTVRLRLPSVRCNPTSLPSPGPTSPLAGPATLARPTPSARGSGPRRDSPSRRAGTAASGQPRVPFSASRHRHPRLEPRLRPPTGGRLCPLLPAGHQDGDRAKPGATFDIRVWILPQYTRKSFLRGRFSLKPPSNPQGNWPLGTRFGPVSVIHGPGEGRALEQDDRPDEPREV